MTEMQHQIVISLIKWSISYNKHKLIVNHNKFNQNDCFSNKIGDKYINIQHIFSSTTACSLPLTIVKFLMKTLNGANLIICIPKRLLGKSILSPELIELANLSRKATNQVTVIAVIVFVYYSVNNKITVNNV